MRADRLLSILMILQSRGKRTAEELALELGVSERTIYRDIDALAISGVPVYANLGPGGGFALLDRYRTSLTGLKPDELQALFMLSVPGPLERLGFSQELRSALLKLSASLSEAHGAREDQVKQRFYLDWEWWFQSSEPAPHLKLIQQAVWEDRCLQVGVKILTGEAVQDVPIEPYGLVAKAGVWYVVAMRVGRFHVYRVSDLIDVALTDENFTRVPGFSLEQFWKEWCEQYERNVRRYPVVLKIAPQLMKYIFYYFDYELRARMTETAPADEKGWHTVTLYFEGLESARGKVLACGGAVEVLEPLALRCTIADQAEHIAALYR